MKLQFKPCLQLALYCSPALCIPHQALEICELNDRLHLKTAYHCYGKYSEALGAIPAAINRLDLTREGQRPLPFTISSSFRFFFLLLPSSSPLLLPSPLLSSPSLLSPPPLLPSPSLPSPSPSLPSPSPSSPS